jgi:hypothetical protein
MEKFELIFQNLANQGLFFFFLFSFHKTLFFLLVETNIFEVENVTKIRSSAGLDQLSPPEKKEKKEKKKTLGESHYGMDEVLVC